MHRLSLSDPGALANAHACARAAEVCYCEGAELRAGLAALGAAFVAAAAAGSQSVALCDVGDARVVAFRGTDDRGDWWTNLNFLGVRTPWGRVHRGFQAAAALLWDPVSEAVRSAAQDGKSVWITGHSLGGALAVLTAARLRFEADVRVSGLFTFGQPPVGGGAFARKVDEALGERYWRFVNHTDLVVDAPTLLSVHAGQLRYFDVEGRLHHALTFRRQLADAVLAPRRFGGLSQFTAHGMGRYVELIGACVDRPGAAPSRGPPRGIPGERG